MRILAICAALLLAGCSRPPSGINPYATEHHVVFDSKTDTSKCTSNAIGPHTLLTAAHCVLGTGILAVDGKKHEILGIEYDEADHAIVRVDGAAFGVIAKISSRFLVFGEHVYFIGNPGKNKAVRRDGKYTGMKFSDDIGIMYKFEIAGFHGDSGSGIMDDSGEIVAVLSMADESCDVTALPLAFSPDQYERASK